MTKEQQLEDLKKYETKIRKIHKHYSAEFNKLKKRQLVLLKEVAERVSALRIGELKKAIKRMG